MKKKPRRFKVTLEELSRVKGEYFLSLKWGSKPEDIYWMTRRELLQLKRALKNIR